MSRSFGFGQFRLFTHEAGTVGGDGGSFIGSKCRPLAHEAGSGIGVRSFIRIGCSGCGERGLLAHEAGNVVRVGGLGCIGGSGRGERGPLAHEAGSGIGVSSLIGAGSFGGFVVRDGGPLTHETGPVSGYGNRSGYLFSLRITRIRQGFKLNFLLFTRCLGEDVFNRFLYRAGGENKGRPGDGIGIRGLVFDNGR